MIHDLSLSSRAASAHVDKASPFRSAQERFRAGRMGMLVFLASLTVLFIAGLVGYVVTRVILKEWPEDLPALPWTLMLSTLFLAISSCTLQRALNSVRRDRLQHIGLLMAATTVLALAFLLMQGFAWSGWFAAVADRWETSQPYRWALASFYVLTGIHALHVLGGVIPMIIVTAKALRKHYDAAHYAGIHYCAMYWHFLGGVWLVLYLTLLIGT